MIEHTPLFHSKRFFYGYWIVAFTFLCLTICIGCGSFVFSLFVNPLQAALGWSRGEIMVGFTIFWAMMGLASPLVGRIVDRYGARVAMCGGAVVMALGFIIVSRMSMLPFFYFGYVLVGAGAAGIGPVPTSAVISYWFKKKRGTAVGLTSAGIGAGGVIMAPVAGYLLETVGWRLTYFSLGVIVCLAIIPLALLIVRTRPEELGLHPDGATDEAVAAAAAANGGYRLEGISLRRAMYTLAFWFICVSYLLGNFSSMGGLQAQVPNLEDIGFPTATAAVALSAIGFGSGVGKILFGWLCDRMHPKHASAIGLSLQCAALLILLRVGPDSSLSLVWAYALLMGFGAGSWLPTMSMLVSHRFGLAHYGSVFGVVNMAQSIGTATGPLVAGLVFDVTGTYHWAFVLFASLYVVAIPAVLLVKRPRVPAD